MGGDDALWGLSRQVQNVRGDRKLKYEVGTNAKED